MTDSLSAPARALLDAVTALASDLDLHSVLTRIVEAACQLTDARYGALGVIGSDGSLVDFITTGLDEEQRALIGDLPRGHGILGLIIREPEGLRLVELAAHEQSTGFPPNHPPMTTFLGMPVRIRGTVFGNVYLTDKAGGQPFTADDEHLVEALARTAGYVIENARAYRLSERRRQWLEAAAELSDALQPPIEIDRALRRITSTARHVAGARAAAITGQSEIASTLSADAADLRRVGAVLDHVPASDDPVELELDGLDVLVIPLRAHLAPAGALVVMFDHTAAGLEIEDKALLASYADQAALALDRAQAMADRQQLALISDRERIARDLHDVVIQRLFATGLHLQGIASLAGSGELAARLDGAVGDLDVTIKEIRGTIFELQNPGADSVRSEVRALVREYQPVLGFAATVATTGPVDTAVGPRVRAELVPVLREALSNVARHARASRVGVHVTVAGGELLLEVDDDGMGLPDGHRESGLANVRHRAEGLGGDLTIRSSARGTTLRWRVPLS